MLVEEAKCRSAIRTDAGFLLLNPVLFHDIWKCKQTETIVSISIYLVEPHIFICRCAGYTTYSYIQYVCMYMYGAIGRARGALGFDSKTRRLVGDRRLFQAVSFRSRRTSWCEPPLDCERKRRRGAHVLPFTPLTIILRAIYTSTTTATVCTIYPNRDGRGDRHFSSRCVIICSTCSMLFSIYIYPTIPPTNLLHAAEWPVQQSTTVVSL